MNNEFGGSYNEVVLEIGNWALFRRDDGKTTTIYKAMIGHQCRGNTSTILINGEKSQYCGLCGDRVPDEIWGLWQLLFNDQYRGFK